MRRDVQGLRAIAILSVLAFHADLEGFGGGYVGVDIFFVISGLVITGSLLRSTSAGTFSVAGFYARRARRLIPAFFAMAAAASIVATVLFTQDDLLFYAKSLVASALALSNYFFYYDSGYFAYGNQIKPLLHTWSLSVEAQFYLVFPFLLALYGRRPKLGLAVIAVCALVSMGACILMTFHDRPAAFYFAPFRVWEFLAGAVLALLPPVAASQRVQEAVAWLGLGLLAGAITAFSQGIDFPGFLAIIPVAGTAMLIYSGGQSLPGRVLALPPFQFFGNISYSLYLWHWPVFAFFKYWKVVEPNGLETAAAIAISVLLGALSWRFVEQPFRRQKSARENWGYISAGASVALMAAGAAIIAGGGFPNRFPMAANQLAAQSGPEFRASRRDCLREIDAPANVGEPCVLGGTERPSIAVWGDSHALALSEGLTKVAGELGKPYVFFGRSGCTPIVASVGRTLCDQFNEHVLDRISNDATLRTVLLASRYGGLTSRNLPQKKIELGKQIDRLTAAGKRVVLVYAIPGAGFNVPAMMASLAKGGGDVSTETFSLSESKRRQSLAYRLLDEVQIKDGVTRVRPSDALCKGDTCRLVIDNNVLYHDTHHLSRYGSVLASSVFEPIFRDETAAAVHDNATAPLGIDAEPLESTDVARQLRKGD